MKGQEIFLLEEGNSKVIFHPETLKIFNVNEDETWGKVRALQKKDYSKYSESDISILNSKIEEVVKESPLSIKNKSTNRDLFHVSSVILPISGNCNLKCTYCFAHDEGKIPFKSFSKNEAKSAIDKLMQDRSYDDSLNITFFGGEPFLNFEVLKFVVNYANSQYPKYKINFSATTNGTILTEEIITFLEQNKITLLVSLDGPQEINRHRKYKNGGDSYSTVASNIEKLKNRVKFSLRITISNDNIKNTLRIYKYFEEAKVLFNVVFAYKSGNTSHQLADYTNEDINIIESQLNKVREYYLDKIINEQVDKIYCLSILSDIKTLRYRILSENHCGAGFGLFSITNDGSVFTCEHLVSYTKYSIGNIYGKINSKLKNDFRAENIENIDTCSDCWARNLCLGGCFAEKVLSGIKPNKKPSQDSCSLKLIYFKNVLLLFSKIIIGRPDFFKKNTKKNDERNC
ncbi:Anaerobic sulfatase-maturating enzyme [Salinivirga cyanobacteriivorans]|uniref:Anaerobic sulfatase-maturating enzyme n=1 Tax=Salinivirga cyanobacteriivorans TaxID=1307839 RepID=A0A0S2HVS2_9BACT|nr:radical SAM protein [Salinivirga cyanobacteriivorans]ALO14131.1 Anaerobic sulfatase-maturating enzyme [Salinivirga cyanobacteriivorans]